VRKVLFIFGNLSDADVEWLAANGERKTFRKGAALVQQGKEIEEVYILLEGQLSVLAGSSQKDLVINTLQQGEIIGELSFLDSRPPSASVFAATDSVVLAIPCSKLRAKLARDVVFAAKFYRALGVFLADRLRNTTQWLGYAKSDSLRADESAAGEIDPELLNSVAIAAKRFEFLVDRLKITRTSEN